MTKTTFGCALASLAFVLGAAQPSRAAIIFYPNQPGAVQPDENLLFNDPSLTLTGPTVTGITNTSGTLFDITGLETLTADGGQAKVSGSDGTFTNLLIEADALDTFFTEFEANLAVFHDRGPWPTGTVTVTTTNKLGNTATNSYDVGSGENFFSLLATDPDLLRSISISSTVALAEIRQIRVGGLVGPDDGPSDGPTDGPWDPSDGPGDGAVPEPGSLALFGVGLVAAGRSMRRRRV